MSHKDCSLLPGLFPQSGNNMGDPHHAKPDPEGLDFRITKGPSIIFIIYAYDYFYHKRGEGVEK